MKKRVLSVLVAVMLVACMFTSAMAASITFEAKPETVEPGKEFTVTISVPGVKDAGASQIETRISFDPTKLELIENNPPELEGAGDSSKSSVKDSNAKGLLTSSYVYDNDLADELGYDNTIDISKDMVWTAKFKLLEGASEATLKVERFYIEGLEEDGYTLIKYYSVDDIPADGILKIKAAVVCDHNWELVAEKVEPTCLAEGKEAVYVCTICGEEKGGEAIKKLDHVWGEWKLNEDGETESRTCTLCGTVETREYNPETGDTMMAVLFLGMAAMFVAGIVVVNKARKNA